MRGIHFILVAILLNVVGQLCLKRAMIQFGEVEFHLSKFLPIAGKLMSRPFVLVGLGLYVISAFFWLIALSKVELSYAYPMLSIGYMLIFFLSWWVFQEGVSVYRFLGTGVICVGLFLIARS